MIRTAYETYEAYDLIAQSFDTLAPRYDALVERNPIHQTMRLRSLAWLDQAFAAGMRVVEVGCGTGTEALHLARRGVRIIATDVSRAMVELAETRAKAEGLHDSIEFIHCPAARLADVLGDARCDGAYASFGALNCEPDLGGAVHAIARVLAPEASFILSVMSRPCLPEMALRVGRLRVRGAFRRLAWPVAIHLYGAGFVPARPFSEADVRRALGAQFQVVRVEGWLVAVPPPHLAEAWERFRPLHAPLLAFDRRLGRTWPFRGWGDHIHVWARRRSQ